MINTENYNAAFEIGSVPLEYGATKLVDFFSEPFALPQDLDFESIVNENMLLNTSASPASSDSPITPYERAFQLPLPNVEIHEIPPPLVRTESNASSSPAMDTLSPCDLNLSPAISCQPIPSLVEDISSAASTYTVSTPNETTTEQLNGRNAKPGRPKKKFTGTRNTVIPPVSIDAPTVSRNYVMPSATSRKEIPRAAVSKKRGSVELEMTEVEAIEAKRRQNTVAARISRQRKAEHLKALEAEVARLQGIEKQLEAARAETLYWKEKASTAELTHF